ncbi:MAG: hypothetical protein U1E49_02320 [Hyphomicrobiaceae bacterium]
MSPSKESKLIGPIDMTSLPGADVAQSLLTGLAQVQCEAAHLASRRARAWLELPQAMGGCRTLPEVAECQARFVRGFWSDWMHTGQQVAAAWSQAVAKPLQAASAVAPVASGSKGAAEADPFAIWEWWRTDLKAIKPRRSEPASPQANRSDTH